MKNIVVASVGSSDGLNWSERRALATMVNTNSTAIALQNSIAGEQTCTPEELVNIAENWVDIEDQPEVMNAMVDEEIEVIEKEMELQSNKLSALAIARADSDDDEEPEALGLPSAVSVNVNRLTKMEIENMVIDLKANCDTRGGKEAVDHLERYIRCVRSAESNQPKRQRTMHSFFGSGKIADL